MGELFSADVNEGQILNKRRSRTAIFSVKAAQKQ